MKKYICSIVAGLAIAIVPASQAFAWHYDLAGYGKCQSDGSYQITWMVDNTSENQPLNITGSSNTSVVSVGTKIAAKNIGNFGQTVDGTKAGNFNLSLQGNWQSDKTIRVRSATVTLKQACTQPVVTPVVSNDGSKGTSAASTPATVQPAPQVVAPKGAVNAGTGNQVASTNAASAIGLGSSLSILGLGVRRLAKGSR